MFFGFWWKQDIENKYRINVFYFEEELLDRSAEVLERISFEEDLDVISRTLDNIDEIFGKIARGTFKK